jgi:hypothetical protein
MPRSSNHSSQDMLDPKTSGNAWIVQRNGHHFSFLARSVERMAETLQQLYPSSSKISLTTPRSCHAPDITRRPSKNNEFKVAVLHAHRPVVEPP